MQEPVASPPCCLQLSHHLLDVVRAGELSHHVSCLLTIVQSSLIQEWGLETLLIVEQRLLSIALLHLNCIISTCTPALPYNKLITSLK